MKIKIFIGILLISIIAVSGCIDNNDESVDADSFVELQLSGVFDEATFYTFDDNGVNIKYFAVLGSDGKPRTAFDACDVCFNSHKGYRQDGDYMICNNCGNKYAIDGLGTKNTRGGGCWPGYLPHEVKGENIIINIADLKKESSRFN